MRMMVVFVLSLVLHDPFRCLLARSLPVVPSLPYLASRKTAAAFSQSPHQASLACSAEGPGSPLQASRQQTSAPPWITSACLTTCHLSPLSPPPSPAAFPPARTHTPLLAPLPSRPCLRPISRSLHLRINHFLLLHVVLPVGFLLLATGYPRIRQCRGRACLLVQS